MTITLLSLPLKVYSYKPEHIVPRTCSPLSLLDSHPLNLLIHISNKKELRFMNRSLKGHLCILRSPLLSPIQCMSAIGVSPRTYLGFLIEYSPPPNGFVPTIAPGTVALDSSQKNLALLRRRPQLHLRVHKVSCRETRYSAELSAHHPMCLADGLPRASRSTSSRSCTLPRHHRITSLSRALLNLRTNKLPYFFSRNSRSPILVSAPRLLTLFVPGDLK